MMAVIEPECRRCLSFIMKTVCLAVQGQVHSSGRDMKRHLCCEIGRAGSASHMSLATDLSYDNICDLRTVCLHHYQMSPTSDSHRNQLKSSSCAASSLRDS
jgi:hypothetical protein